MATGQRQPIYARPFFLLLLALLGIGVCCIVFPFVHAMVFGTFIAVVMQPVHAWIVRNVCPPFRKHRDGKWRRAIRNLYLLSPHSFRPITRRIRARFPQDSRNPVAWCCDLLTNTPLETARAAISRRRIVAVILTIAILLLGIAAPATFLIQTATDQTTQIIGETVTGLRQGTIQKSILEFYRRPATRDFMLRLEQSTVGKMLLDKMDESLDSQNLKAFLDWLFKALSPDGDNHQATDGDLSLPPDSNDAPAIPDNVPPADDALALESVADATPLPSQKTELEELPDIGTEQGKEPQPRLLILNKLAPYLVEFGGKLLQNLQKYSMKVIAATGTLLLKGLIFIFTLFFALYRGRYACNFLKRVGPMAGSDFDSIATRIAVTSQTILWGGLIGTVVQGLIAMLGFRLAGLPAVFLGLLCMVCAIIPFIGASLVWLPAAIFLMLNGHVKAGIFLVLWGAIVVSNIDGFVRPWVMSRWHNSNLSFPIVFFSLLGGLRVFGFIGLVYGPLIVCLFITGLEIFAAKYKFRSRPAGEHD